jgi:DNA (cytosine-5)-methyltransferase 1
MPATFRLTGDLADVTENFNSGKTSSTSLFQNAGIMIARKVWTTVTAPVYEGPYTTIGDIILPSERIPKQFFIAPEQVPQWEYLKGGKREVRTNKANGFKYNYNEGPMVFPDPLNKAARTIITAEGGSSPSRFKHAISTAKGELRRLTPVELERLNMFPDDHTQGASDSRRAFLMGNALVVGVIERTGKALADRIQSTPVVSPKGLVEETA